MENRTGYLFHGLMSKEWDLITTVGVVGCGLIGGVFFAFSAFVMSGLNRLPPSRATAAMQSINVTAQHPPLMLALFGTAAVCGSLIYRAVTTWGDRRALLLLIGVVIYLIGAILVTIAVNVPLNNQLAVLAPAGPDAPAHWEHFMTLWTLANHIRAVLSLAACALLAAALLQGSTPVKHGAMPHLATSGVAGTTSVWPPAVRWR